MISRIKQAFCKHRWVSLARFSSGGNHIVHYCMCPKCKRESVIKDGEIDDAYGCNTPN